MTEKLVVGAAPRCGKSMKHACDKMVEIIESCWNENNPDDGLTFDERLRQKMQELDPEDKELMDEVLRFE